MGRYIPHTSMQCMSGWMDGLLADWMHAPPHDPPTTNKQGGLLMYQKDLTPEQLDRVMSPELQKVRGLLQ